MLGQEAYTTQKIASLLGVNSISTVTRRASRESWQSATRTGRGGGKLWIVASMPKETRELIASGLLRQQYATHEAGSCAIAGTIYSAMLGTAPAPVQPINYMPAPSATPLFPGASDRERAVATARLAFVREIERMSGLLGNLHARGAAHHLARQPAPYRGQGSGLAGAICQLCLAHAGAAL